MCDGERGWGYFRPGKRLARRSASCLPRRSLAMILPLGSIRKLAGRAVTLEVVASGVFQPVRSEMWRQAALSLVMAARQPGPLSSTETARISKPAAR